MIKSQIVKSIKVLILKATYRKAERSPVGVHVGDILYWGRDAIEVKVASKGTTHRTAPIGAVGPNKDERTTGKVAVARQGQFKGRCNCTYCILTAPT